MFNIMSKKMSLLRSNSNYDSIFCLVGMLILALIGNGGVVIQPILLGGMVDELSLSERSAGFIVAFEMLGFALAALLVSCRIHVMNRRTISAIALAIVVLGNIASSLAHEPLALSIGRFVAGLGAGGCVAVFNATVAGCRFPDKRFAQILIMVMLYGGVAIYVATLLIDGLGLSAVFLVLAFVGFCGFFTIRYIPAKAPPVVARQVVESLSERTKKFYMVALLLGYFLLYAGHMAIWSYEERMGVALGLDRESIGEILGSAMFFGIAGASLAIYLGTRFGRAWPQIVSLLLSVVAALSLVYGGQKYIYMFSAYLITFSWYYGLPYLTGLMAWLDDSGRVAALGGTMFTLGAVCGPALAAAVVNIGGYTLIGWVGAVFYVFCLCMVLPVARASDASEKSNSTLHSPAVGDH